MSLFRVHTTHHVDSEGRRCPASTPGARRVRVRSAKWYGYVAGRKTPLVASRSASLRLLARLREEAEAGVAGRHRRERERPLIEHLAEFEADLRAGRGGKGGRPPGQQHIAKVTKYVRMRLSWGGSVYWLSDAQRRVVSVLLDAYLNSRTPDVPEPVLLDAAGVRARKLAELFARSPAWGTLVVAGTSPASYRLAELPEAPAEEEPRVRLASTLKGQPCR